MMCNLLGRCSLEALILAEPVQLKVFTGPGLSLLWSIYERFLLGTEFASRDPAYVSSEGRVSQI